MVANISPVIQVKSFLPVVDVLLSGLNKSSRTKLFNQIEGYAKSVAVELPTTVLSNKSDSYVVFCLQSFSRTLLEILEQTRIDRSLVY